MRGTLRGRRICLSKELKNRGGDNKTINFKAKPTAEESLLVEKDRVSLASLRR